MRSTDELLEDIGHITDDPSVSPEAMRWRPDPPPPAPSAGDARIEQVVVEVHYADGLVHRMAAHHPRHVEVAVDADDEPVPRLPEWHLPAPVDLSPDVRFIPWPAAPSSPRRRVSLVLEGVHRLEVDTAATARPPLR